MLFCGMAWGEWSVNLIPEGRLFRPAIADPYEIRVALAYEGNNRVNGIIGHYISLVEVVPDSEAEPWKLHFGLEARAAFTMRQQDSRFPLETVDGLIGLYSEWAEGPWAVQFRYTHISAHFADGLPMAQTPYSREFLSLRAAYSPQETTQLYAGINGIVNTVPKVPGWGWQLGAVHFLDLGPSRSMIPFAAFDLRGKEESRYDPSLSLQLGLAITRPPERYRSFRIYYQYYTGADLRGQFYDRTMTYHAFAIEMQL